MSSWVLAILIPFSLFLLGINNLISVVTLSGATVGGVVSIIYILLILRVKENPQKNSVIKVRINRKLGAFLSVLFTLGFFTVFEYVSLQTVLVTSFVLFFYIYALIRSDKNNTSIYRELLFTSRKTGIILFFIFLIILTFSVFSIII